ncbi:ribbon-helix-helix protein, CopG family [Rhizobium sp. XQZ8]|uniref:CopG family ribbon-helix-helix protein n=1 Tax=Rhizobium populisoli TaxID=2859785 RepID=UPI001CA56218|nr:ribbon-helix-helix protein, CopG family [Rhizobium populisoli]MBW6421157.1 ribbon-helix-helix protein, CopG family [Rhizobium populisoli]
MKQDAEISDDLSRRIDRLTERSRLTRSQIIEDALAHGRSLAWQERWIAGVESGLAEAEKGEFASDEEITAVLNKYGPA